MQGLMLHVVRMNHVILRTVLVIILGLCFVEFQFVILHALWIIVGSYLKRILIESQFCMENMFHRNKTTLDIKNIFSNKL